MGITTIGELSPALLSIGTPFPRIAHAAGMISARPSVGQVVMAGRSQAVILEIAGDQAVIAPMRRDPDPMLRGDVPVDPFDLGVSGSSSGWVVRCGSAKAAPTGGMIAFGTVGPGLLADLQRAVRQVAESREMERTTPAGAVRCTPLQSPNQQRGRMLKRAGT
jgi:hypothetical protein